MNTKHSSAVVQETSDKLNKLKGQAAKDAKELKRKAKQDAKLLKQKAKDDAKQLAENVNNDIYKIRHNLQSKLSIRYLIVLTIVVLVLMGIGLVNIYQSNLKTTQLTSHSALSTAAGVVERSIGLMISNAEVAGSSEVLSNPDAQLSDKMTTVKLLKNLNRYVEVGFVGADAHGYAGVGMMDFSAYDHFKVAIKGDNYISEPQPYGSKQAWSVITSVPNYNSDEIVGTVYIVDKIETINNKIAALTFGKTGYAYVLNDSGKVIYHKDINKVYEGFNAIELAKTDKSYADMAKAMQTILSENSGDLLYTNGGTKMYATFLPVPGHEQWTVVLEAPYSEFMGGVTALFIVDLIISVILLALCVFYCRRDVHKIISPLVGVKERLQLLAQGDLTSPVPQAVADDEIGRLSVALNRTVTDLRHYIAQLSDILSKMANSDFTAELQEDFSGDFVSMKISIDKILDAFNETLGNLHSTVNDVSTGSAQLATEAVVLSDGASEQANAVSKLLRSIEHFKIKTTENAQNIESADANASETGRRLNDSNAQMSQLIIAMNDISQKSSEIGKIVSTIENISLQTNILAINASVEAAHAAGKAGKGFAVVADEVRALAEKSSQAASSTKDLIEGSIKAVANGVNLARSTGNSMQAVALRANNILDALDGISGNSSVQEQLVNDITLSADRIASVVQTNSATAQQSASASEQLSAQASALSLVVKQFRLRGIDYTEIENEEIITLSDDELALQNDEIDEVSAEKSEEPAKPKRKRKAPAKKPNKKAELSENSDADIIDELDAPPTKPKAAAKPKAPAKPKAAAKPKAPTKSKTATKPKAPAKSKASATEVLQSEDLSLSQNSQTANALNTLDTSAGELKGDNLNNLTNEQNDFSAIDLLENRAEQTELLPNI
ncbi:MAG: methyl-accepting chemotaxis protein, partial [Oscillospiraceae bacterium]